MDAIKVSVENDSGEKKETKGAKKVVKRKKVVKKPVAKAATKVAPPKKQVAAQKDTAKPAKIKAGKKGIFSHLLVFAVTTAIVGGGIYYWQSGVGEEGIDKLRKDARNTRINLESRLSDIKNKLQGMESENEELKETKKELEEKTTLLDGALKKYSNSDLKLSFHYPVLFGDVNVEIKETEEGKKFSGTFSENDQLVFGGVGDEYLTASSSMNDQFLDTRGFKEKSGKYFYKTIHGSDTEYEIEPMRVVSTINDVALMLNKDGFVAEADEAWDFGLGQNIGTLVNLEHDDFSGLAFINKNTAKFPLADYEEMLKSFEIK